MTDLHFEQTVPEPQRGIPVDLTKEEYIHFSMTLAKTFGVLKMQKPTMLFFALYLVVTLVGIIRVFAESGDISLTMVLMFVLTAVSAVLAMTIMPSRVKKSADRAYDAGDENGNYYGELVVSGREIVKITGENRVAISLEEENLYLEDRDFMAFISMTAAQKSIILPARCLTPDIAKAIREAVFSKAKPIRRRVIKRMEPRATQPIDRREFPEKAQTLYTVDALYEPEEILKLHTDLQWKKYVQSLPMLAVSSMLIGALMAMLEENLLVFFVVSLAMILGYLAISMLSGRSRAKAEAYSSQSRLRLTFTQKGLHMRFSPSGREASVLWKGVERAIERPDTVEFYYSGNHLLRIPKRCIDDMNELRRVVDTHFKPKADT